VTDQAEQLLHGHNVTSRYLAPTVNGAALAGLAAVALVGLVACLSSPYGGRRSKPVSPVSQPT
jgi:hypothetical protein